MSMFLPHSEVNGFLLVDKDICLDIDGAGPLQFANIDWKLRCHQSPKVKNFLRSPATKTRNENKHRRSA